MENLPDVKGYSTRDLFIPHPTKSGLWRMYVFSQSHPSFATLTLWPSAPAAKTTSSSSAPVRPPSRLPAPLPLTHARTGEKVVPLPQEGVLLANTTVPLLSAVMFGREKNQVGVLLEPRPGHEVDGTDAAALSAFRNKIWCVLPFLSVCVGDGG